MNNRFGQDMMRRSPNFPTLDFPYSILGSPFLSRMTDALNIPSVYNLMKSTRLEDGSTKLEYNLAGFKSEEITLSIDTATNDLIIKAERTTPDDLRKFNTVVTLSPYTSPEDVTTRYEDGVLEITIAPLEKRKTEAMVQLPLNSADKKK